MLRPKRGLRYQGLDLTVWDHNSDNTMGMYMEDSKVQAEYEVSIYEAGEKSFRLFEFNLLQIWAPIYID
jgi:hypothetical protein